MRVSESPGVVAAAVLTLTVGLVSCSDALQDRESSDTDSRHQSIRVVPTFEIEGTHDFPENVRFDDLRLSVASITLTPTGQKSSVAYSTSESEPVHFDVDGGNLEQRGEAVELPRRGKFDVTLRLEPVETEDADKEEQTSGTTPYSLAFTGHVAGASSEQSIPDNKDIPPLPAPMEPEDIEDDSEATPADDRAQRPKRWMEFEYTTGKSIELTLNEVELTQDEEILNFRLDVEEWASELATPVERAVQSKHPSETGADSSAVDVTRAVESRGEGTRTLDEHVSVKAVPTKSHGGNGF